MSRVAIITGASSGIGAAAAQQFIAQQFTVLNVSRRPCPIVGVEDVCGDLNSTAAVHRLADEIAMHLDRYRATEICLVHNAALMLKDTAECCSDSDFAQVLQINVMAINTLNRHLLPLLPKGSSVLFIGSTLSEKAVSGAFSYIVSKHAQLGIMRATCQDLMGKGIHTALVCPGFTDTEMLRSHIGHNDDVLTGIGQMNSFGRLIDPSEIASLIVWSHHNPVINGSVLHANLGQIEH